MAKLFAFFNDLLKKPKQRIYKNRIYFDEDNYFDLTGEGVQLCAVGINGTGKTYNCLICYNQMSNVIFFDPQNRGLNILSSQGEKKNWVFLKMTEIEDAPNRFAIRAKDIHARVLNMLAYRTSAKDFQMRQVLRTFLAKPDEERTYEKLKQMLLARRLDSSWEELASILDKDDIGTIVEVDGEKAVLTLKDFQSSGKYCIDISEKSKQDLAIGIVTESIIGHRAKNTWPTTNHLMIAIDEMQDWISDSSFTGRAFGSIAGKARTYNISCGVSGVTQGPIDQIVKNQLKILLIHRIAYEAKTISSRYGILLEEQDILSIPYGQEPELRGWCRLYNRLTDNLTGVLIRPNTYYQTLKRKSEEEFSVREEVIGFRGES